MFYYSFSHSTFAPEIQNIIKMNKTRLFSAFTLLMILFSCESNEKKETAEKPVVKVKTEIVHTNSNFGDRWFVGNVEAESSTSVSFTGSGTIVRMAVSEGQIVSKGQLIAEIDPTQCSNAVTMAETMLSQAKDAEARMKMLYDAKALPDIKWVETESNVKQAEIQLEMARKAVADCSLYAPCSGVIGKGVSNVGETALPAQPIAKILNISKVKIRASIPEKEMAAINSNTETLITVDALGGMLFSGGRIEKGVEGSGITHTYDIKINVPNSGGKLLPGMVCKVNILNKNQQSGGQNRICVPITSVHKNAKGENFVWVVNGKTVSRRIVMLGEATGNYIFITEGLKLKERIVTEGYQKLSEGALVNYEL